MKKTLLVLFLAASSAFAQEASPWHGEWKSSTYPGATGTIQATLAVGADRIEGEVTFVSTMGEYTLRVSEALAKELKISGTAESKDGGPGAPMTLVVQISNEEITGTYEVPGLSDSGTIVLRKGARKREAEFTPSQIDGATLEIVEGIPILRVQGTPEEMGRQAGTLLKDQIRFMAERYFAKMLGDGRDQAVASARQMEKHIPAQYVAEMKAVAEGAGVPYEDILLANVGVELYQLNQCSTVCVRGSLTKGGTLLFGRNLDFPSWGILEQYSVVVEYRPKEGRRFVSVTWPGLVGALSAMNDKGLTIANLVAFGEENDTAGVPYMFLLRQVLEKCETVKEAIREIEGTPRTVANSIMIADVARDAVVLESTASQVRVRRIEEDRLFATNTFLPSRCERYHKLAKAVRSNLDVADIAAMLGLVNLGAETVQSMVFVPERREIHLATGEAPATSAKYVKLSLR